MSRDFHGEMKKRKYDTQNQSEINQRSKVSR